MAKNMKSKKPGRPAVRPEATVPAEFQPVLDGLRRLAAENEEGWAAVAGVFKEHPELEVDVVLPFLARHLGKEALPLLRGAAVDEDASLALAALKALPLLGTRAAGEALVQAYQAYPQGERAQLAWDGVQALRARGINVDVPAPEDRPARAPSFSIRETLESMSDGVGSFSTYVRGQDPYGVWHTIAVVWNDRAGVKQSFIRAIGRHEWERFMAQGEQEGVVVPRVPGDYVRWHITHARALNEKTGLVLNEDDLAAWDRFVGPPPDGYTPPDPLPAVAALEPDAREELTAAAADLLGVPGLQGWAVEPADVRVVWDDWTALDEQESSLSDEEFEAREDEILGRAAAAAVTPELREAFRDRLVDVARKQEWLGDPDARDVAAAIALQIAGDTPVEQIPFFRELARRGLEMLEEMLENDEDPEAFRFDPMKDYDEEEE